MYSKYNIKTGCIVFCSLSDLLSVEISKDCSNTAGASQTFAKIVQC